jgi:hypothetical protein
VEGLHEGELGHRRHQIQGVDHRHHGQNLKTRARGRCYDQHFLLFFANLRRKIGVFLKKQCYDYLFGKN